MCKYVLSRFGKVHKPFIPSFNNCLITIIHFRFYSFSLYGTMDGTGLIVCVFVCVYTIVHTLNGPFFQFIGRNYVCHIRCRRLAYCFYFRPTNRFVISIWSLFLLHHSFRKRIKPWTRSKILNPFTTITYTLYNTCKSIK